MKAKEKALLDKIHKLQHEKNLFSDKAKELSTLKNENARLKEEYSRLEVENSNLSDWVNRLLEYTEMSKEDLKMLIDKEKSISRLSSIVGFGMRRMF